MAYVKNTWVDQDVERPKTYEVTNNQDGSITLTDSFGLVTELGTPVNEVNMNHIEDGIDGCAIRKHNLTETFNLGEWVLGGIGDDEGIYKSLIDNNVGNAITDDTKWEKVEMGGGASRNIGEIVTSTIPLEDAGLHLLDGTLISGSGSYSAFVDYIAGLVTDYPDLFCTEADWQTDVTTYGVCGKFVYDSVNNTVRLPKYSNQIYTSNIASATSVIGNGKTLGWEIGNSTVYGTIFNTQNAGSVFGVGPTTYSSSPLGTSASYTSATTNKLSGITTDPTKSGLIADLSNITTSLDGYYYIVVATSTKTDIQVDIDEIATDLNGKADVDLTNVNNSGTSKSAGWAFPSNNIYEDLTLGATGATYTASANGYISFAKFPTAAGQMIQIVNATSGLGVCAHSGNNATALRIFFPIKKGESYQVYYTAAGNTINFRFIYAVGCESEYTP